MWLINLQAQRDFLSMGPWAVPMLAMVAISCLLTAVGLWRRARWGQRLAVTLFSVNLVGSLANVLVRGDLRSLVGVPIVAALIWYLLSEQVRCQFQTPEDE